MLLVGAGSSGDTALIKIGAGRIDVVLRIECDGDAAGARQRKDGPVARGAEAKDEVALGRAEIGRARSGGELVVAETGDDRFADGIDSDCLAVGVVNEGGVD